MSLRTLTRSHEEEEEEEDSSCSVVASSRSSNPLAGVVGNSYQHADSARVVEYMPSYRNDNVDDDEGSWRLHDSHHISNVPPPPQQQQQQQGSANDQWWWRPGASLQSCFRRSTVPTKRVPFLSTSPATTKQQPLLFPHVSSSSSFPNNNDDKTVRIAAILLRDYEHGRVPTLPESIILQNTNTAVVVVATHQALMVHDWRFSNVWKIIRMLAVLVWFVATGWEGTVSSSLSPLLSPSQRLSYACLGNGLAMMAFLIDMGLRHLIGLPPEPLRNAMLAFMTATSLELVYRVMTTLSDDSSSSSNNNNESACRFWITSAFKPVALFYISEKARQAYLSIARIAPIVSRVLALELLLILSFAAVACRLYAQYESFATLSQSWLSLFQLSTTVVNPSMWMPMYQDNRTAAFFFIPFDIATTLYLHSLVLSVVFQTYVQASTEVHAVSMENREETLRLSFQALCKQASMDNDGEAPATTVPTVQSRAVRRTIEKLRPHYSELKINALMDIYNNGSINVALDYPQYRHRIQQVMNASIRAAPTRTILAHMVEYTAALVACVNLVYILLFSSAFQTDWFDSITKPAGYTITMLGVFELVVRIDPFGVLHFTPVTKLNATFDGIAALAACISLYGLVNDTYEVELLLTGRAIDMLRIMRFQKIFRDVIRRSGEILPALAGPLSMLVATNHFFVYIGMALWGGAIDVGTYENITPRYDLNNFNSYWEGMVTMFNVLIVNDWHAIAEVYTYASRNSQPYIVYPFFVAGNLVSVSIMLNCVTAFFVGAFVAKLEEEDTEEDEIRIVTQKTKQFKIDATARSIRRISSSGLSVSSSRSLSQHNDVIEFDVYERPTYDKIMRTVSGGENMENDVAAYARDISDKIKTFEELSPLGGQKLGFLIVCQQKINRYGNRRFQILAEQFMDPNKVYAVASELHDQLSESQHRGKIITRTIHKAETTNLLTIKASLIRQSPPVSLLVASVSPA